MSGKIMAKNGSKRKDVVMAGLGGSGVLLVGETLLHAAEPLYEYVTYFPSYGTAMRGGAVECSVVLSNERIGSPMLPLADVVVIFDAARLKEFEGRVRPGGQLLLENTNVTEEPTRTDIKILRIPAREISAGLGDTRATNQVMLGAYIAATGAVAPDVIEKEIEKRLKNKGLSKLVALNLEAFRKGMQASKGGN
ncbi:MAG: 2-oxoacid:acceptor oxidoreductase family protein [Dehalococcoidia bacterium]|nr:2-oxoacid:acceptor oxidoreductase family protein [Dehalococcoidia bacterium]